MGFAPSPVRRIMPQVKLKPTVGVKIRLTYFFLSRYYSSYCCHSTVYMLILKVSRKLYIVSVKRANTDISQKKFSAIRKKYRKKSAISECSLCQQESPSSLIDIFGKYNSFRAFNTHFILWSSCYIGLRLSQHVYSNSVSCAVYCNHDSRQAATVMCFEQDVIIMKTLQCSVSYHRQEWRVHFFAPPPRSRISTLPHLKNRLHSAPGFMLVTSCRYCLKHSSKNEQAGQRAFMLYV